MNDAGSEPVRATSLDTAMVAAAADIQRMKMWARDNTRYSR